MDVYFFVLCKFFKAEHLISCIIGKRALFLNGELTFHSPPQLTWGGFYDLFTRMNEERNEVFSMKVVKPWLLPGLICEIVFTGIGILMIIVKMKYLRNKKLSLVVKL